MWGRGGQGWGNGDTCPGRGAAPRLRGAEVSGSPGLHGERAQSPEQGVPSPRTPASRAAPGRCRLPPAARASGPPPPPASGARVGRAALRQLRGATPGPQGQGHQPRAPRKQGPLQPHPEHPALPSPEGGGSGVAAGPLPASGRPVGSPGRPSGAVRPSAPPALPPASPPGRPSPSEGPRSPRLALRRQELDPGRRERGPSSPTCLPAPGVWQGRLGNAGPAADGAPRGPCTGPFSASRAPADPPSPPPSAPTHRGGGRGGAGPRREGTEGGETLPGVGGGTQAPPAHGLWLLRPAARGPCCRRRARGDTVHPPGSPAAWPLLLRARGPPGRLAIRWAAPGGVWV